MNQGGIETLKPSRDGVRKLGIYKNSGSGNLFYSCASGARNRVKPDKVYLDDDGFICVVIEQRDPANQRINHEL